MFLILPFGEIILQSGEIIALDIFGVDYLKTSDDTNYFLILPTMVIIILSTLITFISIFMYKKRILQIRLNVFNLILQICSIGLLFYFLIQASKELNADYSTNVLIVLPLVSAILTFLAIRAIARDEALIKSLDRLR